MAEVRGNVLVFGSTGMLGHVLAAYFRDSNYRVLQADRTVFDIYRDPHEKIANILDTFDPDIIVNAAGIIKQVITRVRVEEALVVNSIFPLNLAKVCEQKG